MGFAVVILAAGEGKRMKSALPKVLHQVCAKPMIDYVLETVRDLRPDKVLIVVGHGADKVRDNLKREGSLKFVFQEKQLGTGHAVLKCEKELADFSGTVLVLSGDTPLLSGDTLKSFLELHLKSKAAATLLSANLEGLTGYGRIIRSQMGEVERIIEEKDASKEERNISEVNTGTYCFDKEKLFLALKEVKCENVQKEFYLTDVIEILKRKKEKVAVLLARDEKEVLGVNSRSQLVEVDKILREKINNKWMESGVTIIDPVLTFISPEVLIGKDTIIYPLVFLEGKTTIGENCLIGPSTRLIDVKVGNGSEITYSVAKECEIGDEAKVGPFSYIRPGTKIKNKTKVGTFVEIKKSEIGEGSKVPHLSYIGDALIGKNVNVGAGSITCNFDGVEKHQTIIEDEVFIGSDTMLIAPVKIGKRATTGAGSAISRNVPADSLGLERAEQKNIKDWRKKRKK